MTLVHNHCKNIVLRDLRLERKVSNFSMKLHTRGKSTKSSCLAMKSVTFVHLLLSEICPSSTFLWKASTFWTTLILSWKSRGFHLLVLCCCKCPLQSASLKMRMLSCMGATLLQTFMNPRGKEQVHLVFSEGEHITNKGCLKRASWLLKPLNA